MLESITKAVNTLLESMDPSMKNQQSTDLATSTSNIVRTLEKQVTVTMGNQEEVSNGLLHLKPVHPL